MDAWDPDKPLPPDILARLLAVMPLKEHLPGQHDQADHGRWASDSEFRNTNSDAENAVDAGFKIKTVTRGGDKALTIRRYAATGTAQQEFSKVRQRVETLEKTNYAEQERISAQLLPALTKLMSTTPFAGNEELWVQNATSDQINEMISQGFTDPADIAAAKSLIEVRAADRALQALRGLTSNAPENPHGYFGRHEGQETYLVEDVDGKPVGVVRYHIDEDLKNINVEEMVELGVAPGMVTMAVGAAMKHAAEKGFSVSFPRTYFSGRAFATPNGSEPGIFGWGDKLMEIGVPNVELDGKDARYNTASYLVSAGDVKDWTRVALEDVDKMFGLPSAWKKDPSKPFDPPPSEITTYLQHQQMVLKAKATPSPGMKLSLEEIGTVQSWQSMDWRGINQAAAIMSENPVDGLVGSDLEGSDMDTIVEELDSIAARNSAEEDWILWRGVSAPGLKGNPGADPRREAGMIAAIRGAGEGGIIESGKFVSMTTDEAVASSFADDRMLRISVPAATKGFWIENLAAANPDLPKFLNEKEFVTARGTKYRVDKIDENHPEYGFYAELTVVP